MAADLTGVVRRPAGRGAVDHQVAVGVEVQHQVPAVPVGGPLDPGHRAGRHRFVALAEVLTKRGGQRLHPLLPRRQPLDPARQLLHQGTDHDREHARARTRGARSFARGGMRQHGDHAAARRPSETTVSPPTVTVFTSGTEGYHTFRIPALLVLGDDQLLAFAEARRDGAADSGEIDLVQRRSSDGGRTWGPLELIRHWAGYTCGNPAPVLTDGGDLVLLSLTNGAEATEADILTGQVPADQGRRVWVQRSADVGRTWTEPVEITAAVSRPDWRWYATGPTRGIQLPGGRIVVPANHSRPIPDGGYVYSSHAVLSDDGGRTWRLGVVARPRRGVLEPNESAVTELPDGRVLFLSRNEADVPAHQRLVAVSATGGETLDRPYAVRADLAGTKAQAGVALLPGPDLLATVVLRGPGRRDLELRVSGSEGRRWRHAADVWPGPAAYCDVATDGPAVLLLFEAGEQDPYEGIRLARIDAGDLGPRTR
jgi:sialidase-1